MRLNPEFVLIKNKFKYLIYDSKRKKYYEIDEISYDFLQEANQTDIVRTNDNSEIYDFYLEKSIITDHLNKKKEKHNFLKKGFSITQIHLFSFDINKIFDKYSKVFRVFLSDEISRIINIFYVMSIVVSLMALMAIFQFVSEFVNIVSADKSIVNEVIELNIGMKLYDVVIIYISIFCMNMFHELGHAIQCKKYTGFVGECGCMLFFLFPVLYTDITVSNTAKIEKKKKIIWAGIMNQLLISGFIGTIFLLQYLISAKLNLTVLILFTVNLVMILSNLNPFYKYDGYWLISTHFNIDNLYSKAVMQVFKIRRTDSNYRNQHVIFLYGISLIIFYVITWTATMICLFSFLSMKIGAVSSLLVIAVVFILIFYELISRYKECKNDLI